MIRTFKRPCPYEISLGAVRRFKGHSYILVQVDWSYEKGECICTQKWMPRLAYRRFHRGLYLQGRITFLAAKPYKDEKDRKQLESWRRQLREIQGCDCDLSRPMTEGEAEIAKGLEDFLNQPDNED